MMTRDALDELVSDLQIQAGQLDICDADAREHWIQACHQVLEAIEDPQRKLDAVTNLAILLTLKCGGLSSSQALGFLNQQTWERLWPQI